MTTANDTALADLQAGFAQLQADVESLIASIGTDTSDDISAGVAAVTSAMAALDTDVQTALGTADESAPSADELAAPADADAPVDVPGKPAATVPSIPKPPASPTA